MFKYVDLFAGMGGMRLGLEQALSELGISGECVFSSEIKTHAVSVYKSNFVDAKVFGDITQIDEKELPNFDMLIAGFPCQSFSSAGRRRGFEDTRGTLFFDVARILREKQPSYFLLENVENLVIHDLSKRDKKEGKKIGKTLETILSVLTSLGYIVNWKVLQASDFGVPQIRRRIYIVGRKTSKVDLNDFPLTTVPFSDIQEHDLPCVHSEFTEKLSLYMQKNNLSWCSMYGKAIRDKRGSCANIHSWTLGLRGTVTASQQLLLDTMVTVRRRSDLAEKKGQPLKDGVGLTYSELEDIYTGTDLQKTLNYLLNCGYLAKKKLDVFPEMVYDIVGGRLSYQFTKIIDPTKPCLTLVATDACKLGVIDNDGLRQLTIRECLRLNGYPETFKCDETYIKGLDLLGNTVVVPVIKSVCLRILSGEKQSGKVELKC